MSAPPDHTCECGSTLFHSLHRPPLPLPDEHWRSRWLVLPSWNRLHRVSEIVWEDSEDDGMRAGMGTTLCGRRGFLQMPGILSRMGAPRCADCCRILGIPTGDGAPFNADEEWRGA